MPKQIRLEYPSSVMGVNPDSTLTGKDVMSKIIDKDGNAEMGKNVTAENAYSCENSATMGETSLTLMLNQTQLK